MNKQLIWCVCLLALVVTAGCGKIKYSYPALLDPEMGTIPRLPVLVAVQDQRPAIVIKKASESYAGVVRSLYPTSIYSVTSRPLAEDVANAIVRKIERNGGKATALRLEPTLSEADVLKDFARLNPGFVLFIAIRELTPDMSANSGNTAVYCDLGLTVYDTRGKIVGAATVAGKEVYDTPWRYQEKIAESVNNRFSDLLNDPEVVKALQ